MGIVEAGFCPSCHPTNSVTVLKSVCIISFISLIILIIITCIILIRDAPITHWPIIGWPIIDGKQSAEY